MLHHHSLTGNGHGPGLLVLGRLVQLVLVEVQVDPAGLQWRGTSGGPCHRLHGHPAEGGPGCMGQDVLSKITIRSNRTCSIAYEDPGIASVVAV